MSSQPTWNTKNILRVFWQHVSRYPRLTVGLFVAAIASNILELLLPIFYKRFFDILSQPSFGSMDERAPLLIHVLFLILSLALVNLVCSRAAAFLNVHLEPRVMVGLERTAFRHLLRHSYQFFTDNFAGSLVRKVHRLSRSFEEIFDILRESFLAIFIALVGIFIVVYQRSPRIAFLVLGWSFLFMLINYSFSRWKLKYDLARAAKDSETTGVLSDALSNSINIKLFNGYEHENGFFHNMTEQLRRLRVFGWSLGEGSNSLQILLIILIEFAVMYVAVRFWQRGQLTIGDFALLQAYLITLFSKLGDFRRMIRRMYESLADATEMVEILDMPHEIQDVKNAKALTIDKGIIEFQNAFFSYHQTRTVLRGLDLKIKSREKVALVGPSGAGKSTVVKLLLRFHDLDRGKILIDGQSLSKVSQDSLRDQIALVPQEPVLFHRTLMENIRYGRRDASDAEVIEAAKKAHCHEFIENSPQGYETFVGERGVKLSGGERQRIAIARAILKNAPILILDEATSSLDSESEALIQDALRELMKNKTAIAIAHRLSTIMQMDRIIVMDQGKVIDMGTHDVLLKKDSIYRKLWEIQAGGFLP